MRSGRRQVVVAAVIATAAASVVVTATPAAATDPCWRNGADMVGSSCGRHTYIVDLGVGTALDRGALLQHQGYYQQYGFSPNFLWYAPETDYVVHPGSTQEWSGCNFNTPGPTCAPSQVHYRPIVNAFSDDDHGIPIRLPSLAFGSAFIALACGNFSAGGAASPVPVISGHKFHDHDRDGVRDAGEPGLAGWTMTLHRDRSDAGQALGGVATAVTNADGYYEFRLDGHYPGDYAVTEEDRRTGPGPPAPTATPSASNPASARATSPGWTSATSRPRPTPSRCPSASWTRRPRCPPTPRPRCACAPSWRTAAPRR